MRCDRCGRWETTGGKAPTTIQAVGGQLPKGKTIDLCDNCRYVALKLKPLAR